MAQRTVIGQDRIVYSTHTDLVEQDLDKRFPEIEKSDREKDTITRYVRFHFLPLVNVPCFLLKIL